MNIPLVVLTALLVRPIHFSFPGDHLFETNHKIPAYNMKSEKVIKSVSLHAIEHSEALIPCTDPSAHCDDIKPEIKPVETPMITVRPTEIYLSPIPHLTPVQPQPSSEPIDPNPCNRKWEGGKIPPPARPMIQDSVVMPCPVLDNEAI